MKIILYMASTANGIIAKENDEVPFVSDESWKSYQNKIKETKAVILGRKTYEIMPEDEFEKEVKYYIFTSKINLEKKSKNIQFINKTPKEFINEIKNKHYQICICGGSKINSQFAKENLIDEIYLDIEPNILAKGITLFSQEEFELNLKLLNLKKLSENTIQLHYLVLK